MSDLPANPAATAVDHVNAFVAVGPALLVARSSGVYRSDDGGVSWRGLYAALESLPATTALAASPDGLIVAGVSGGILVSRDSGESWRAIVLPEPAPLPSAVALSPAFADDGVILAATLDDGVFRSDDRGQNWAAWNYGLLDTRLLCLTFLDAQTVLVGAEGGLFRSSNGGRAWRDLRFDHAPVQALARAGAAVYAATEANGLYRSNDGGDTWTRVGADTLPEAINGLHPLPSGGLLAVAPDAVWRTDDGDDWRVVAPDVAVTALHPLDVTHALAGLDDGTIIRLDIHEGAI